MNSLLLIACSSRKSKAEGQVQAIDRYDGVSHRIIRKIQREGQYPSHVDIKIISAEYGLIDATTPIPFYDRMMDKKRADKLHKKTLDQLSSLLQSKRYSEVFLNLGKNYMRVIDGYENLLEPTVMVHIAKGGIGLKNKAMKEWLQHQRGRD